MTEPNEPELVSSEPTAELSLATQQFTFTAGIAVFFGVATLLPAEMSDLARLPIGALPALGAIVLLTKFPGTMAQLQNVLAKPTGFIPLAVVLIAAVVLVVTNPWGSAEFRHQTRLYSIYCLTLGVANFVRMWIKFADTSAPVATRYIVVASLLNSLVVALIPLASISYQDSRDLSPAGAILVALGINELIILFMGVMRVRDQRRAAKQRSSSALE